MIDGVIITPLKRIGDERGMVLHMLRRDWAIFEDFGEVYFSTVKFGVIKAWKRHKLSDALARMSFSRINIANIRSSLRSRCTS